MTTTIKSTKQSLHFYIPNTEKLDISKIYNRIFFDIFHLRGYRVYVRNVKGEMTETEVSTETAVVDITAPSDNPQFSDILGKEQTPNGYSILPLEYDVEPVKKEEEIGIFDSFSQYISKFSGKPDPTAPNTGTGGIMVSFPLDAVRPIVTIHDLFVKKRDNTESIYQFKHSTSTYEFVETVLRDLYIQLDYLKQIGLIYTDVKSDTVYRIQDRTIILDSSHLEPLSSDTRADQEKRIYKSVVNLIATLMGVDSETDFTIRFGEIQDTRVYYVIKRLEYENVFEWV
jgi:hypothetical protein